jgi:hypothetical protein
MNDLLSDTKAIVWWLFGALTAVFTWFLRRQDRRIEKLEAQYVTREELDRNMTQMRQDRLRMHDENRESLQYIRERVDTIIDRQAQR